MIVVLASPNSVAPSGVPRRDVVDALIAIANDGSPVVVVSNHSEPAWFATVFYNSKVGFLQWASRQDGTVVSDMASKLSVKSHDFVVLGATFDDFQMAKNGKAVFVASEWALDSKIKSYGLMVNSGGEFYNVFRLASRWENGWWFKAETDKYNVRALADLSSMYGQGVDQQVFSSKVKLAVKAGGDRLKALLVVTARSLLADGVGDLTDLIWGVYPSSNSQNNDSEILSNFSHRLRTVSSRVQFAKVGEPLFIRHKPSVKRSAGGAIDRTSPVSQIESIHLNPFYREKGRLLGRHVILLDDCTTYGVSFGVASALLYKAGAAGVTCVALGKFGNCLNYYDLKVYSDPFSPLMAGMYEVGLHLPLNGVADSSAKRRLIELID